MKQARKMMGWLLALAVLAFAPFAQAADAGGEKEARAAFVKLVDAAKKKQVKQFKQLIAKADLKEMEAMEKEKAGMIDFMMTMLAADDPKQFKADVKPDSVTFKKSVTNKSKDGTSTETTTVTMVREDGQWKFGKPGK